MSLFHNHVNKYASYYKAAGDAPGAPSAPQFRSTGGGQWTKQLLRTVGGFIPDLVEFAAPTAHSVFSNLPSPAAAAGSTNAFSGTVNRSIPNNNIKGITKLPSPAAPVATSPMISYTGPNMPARSSTLIT